MEVSEGRRVSKGSRILFPLLSLKKNPFTSWFDFKIKGSSQHNLPYRVLLKSYVHYPPILGSRLCTRHICSCHGKGWRKDGKWKDGKGWGWVLRDRRGLLIFKWSLRDEMSRARCNSCCKKELKPAADHWLFNTAPEVCHFTYLLILLYPKASYAISICETQ